MKPATTIPLAPDKTVHAVLKRFREIEKRGRIEILHLAEFLGIDAQVSYPEWKAALQERHKYYKNRSTLPEADAAVNLGQLLKSYFENEDGWRSVLNGLGKVHVEASVKTSARGHKKKPVSKDVVGVFVQQAQAAGAPDAEELIAWLFEQYGVKTAKEPAAKSANERKRAEIEEELATQRLRDLLEAKQRQHAPSRPLFPGNIFREKLKDGKVGPDMVVLPAGSFLMGSTRGEGKEDEWPQHKVIISEPFAMGRFPVTFDEYDLFCETTRRKKLCDKGWGRVRQPVINISSRDAIAYCEWLSGQTGKLYRLPSEAEWEYACRAGTTTRYYWGDYPGKNRANFDGSGSKWSGKQTSPVGSFYPNPFGLYDMLGNGSEWCQDCTHRNYERAPSAGSAWKEDGGGNCERSVLRGGNWHLPAVSCRTHKVKKHISLARLTEVLRY